jgi:hypothetical protein
MNKTEHMLGLTGPMKRLAYDFLKKGLGRHACNSFGFDEVVVRELYEWTSPGGDLPAQGGLVVEFRSGGKRVRWVEFACRDVGGGGEPILREV